MKKFDQDGIALVIFQLVVSGLLAGGNIFYAMTMTTPVLLLNAISGIICLYWFIIHVYDLVDILRERQEKRKGLQNQNDQ